MAARAFPWQTGAMKIYFDGGCRPNPGPIQTAVVARGRAYYRDDLGEGDNNDAEWLALLDALAVARSLGALDVTLLGDSALVVDQAGGIAVCRPRFRDRLAEFQALAGTFERLRIRWIRRSHNLAGIALERAYRAPWTRGEHGGPGGTCRG
jgi:ribonuclease HI